MGKRPDFSERWQIAAGVTGLAGLAAFTVYLVGIAGSRADINRYDLEGIPPAPWAYPALGLAVILLAVAAGLAVVGVLKRRRRLPAASTADLRPLIMERPVPFTVCTSCRIIIDLPLAFSCPQCDQTDRCVRVEEDDERSFAISALGPPPS